VGLPRDVVASVLVQLEGHAGLSGIRVGGRAIPYATRRTSTNNRFVHHAGLRRFRSLPSVNLTTPSNQIQPGKPTQSKVDGISGRLADKI